MKIQTLIDIFERLLVLYSNPKNYRDADVVYMNRLDDGLCKLLFWNAQAAIDRHYKNYLTYRSIYLFPTYYAGKTLSHEQKVALSITPRKEFLKREIPYLKSLLKKGYTYL